MNLLDIVHRTPVPEAWAEGEKIPWDDPGFSHRMLAEHLSQAHDHASRRAETIETHVAWIHNVVLEGRSARILDLGCGPGLYTERLARLGHSCVGIDFSPAAIDYATTAARGLDCAYHLGDIREADYGREFDLVMLIFGEFNVFRRTDAQSILARSRQALVDGGRLLLEVHTVEAVQRIGTVASAWRTAERGLFSDRPHLRFEESFWDERQRVATERYFIVDAETAAVTRYAQSMQAYTDDEYRSMLRDGSFALRDIFPSLPGNTGGGDFIVLLAVSG